jgi:hypothetical protein
MLSLALAGVPLAAGPASACPQPQEGQPKCCQNQVTIRGLVPGSPVELPINTSDPRCE